MNYSENIEYIYIFRNNTNIKVLIKFKKTNKNSSIRHNNFVELIKCNSLSVISIKALNKDNFLSNFASCVENNYHLISEKETPKN